MGTIMDDLVDRIIGTETSEKLGKLKDEFIDELVGQIKDLKHIIDNDEEIIHNQKLIISNLNAQIEIYKKLLALNEGGKENAT